MPKPTLDQIWDEDLLDRRGEADLLADYVGCSVHRNGLREDMKAFTISVDAEYGVGKSFFLRRLALQMSGKHPVAYIDAWSDDLADEPLTALAATLSEALAPHLGKKKVREAWQQVVAASGEVAKIAAGGLLKRIIGFAITGASADLLATALSSAPKDVQTAAPELVASSANDGLEAVGKAFEHSSPERLMSERIATFKAGQAAIAAMKHSLSKLVSALASSEFKPPIVIVVDELDRCRPTYAIKVLEEIKHLFDVEGVVFILGMNLAQLSHSVTAAYGNRFDGEAYLRRFVCRQYRLKAPELTDLLSHLLRASGIPDAKLEFPRVAARDGGFDDLSNAQVVARYMDAYGLYARDAFLVVDRLQTCVALTGDVPLQLPYLLPLLMGQIRGASNSTILPAKKADALSYGWGYYNDAGQYIWGSIGIESMAAEMEAAANLSLNDLTNQTRRNSSSPSYDLILRARVAAARSQISLANPSEYPALLETVGRFSTTVGPVEG